MKNLFQIFSALALSLALLTCHRAQAATWNDALGMGNLGNTQWQFSGTGASNGVLQSVTSNLVYYITSAAADGQPVIERTMFRADTIAATLDFYVATNSWIVASNGAHDGITSTNILWLTSTNAGMKTNDFLVYRSTATDCYQLTSVSGSATDSTGLVFTNSSGYNAIKLWQTLTNVPAAGDVIYKMTRLQTFSPLAMNALTNQYGNPTFTNNFMGQWMEFSAGTPGDPKKFVGRIGYPTALVLTCSNVCNLSVDGQYFVRQRR